MKQPKISTYFYNVITGSLWFILNYMLGSIKMNWNKNTPYKKRTQKTNLMHIKVIVYQTLADNSCSTNILVLFLV